MHNSIIGIRGEDQYSKIFIFLKRQLGTTKEIVSEDIAGEFQNATFDGYHESSRIDRTDVRRPTSPLRSGMAKGGSPLPGRGVSPTNFFFPSAPPAAARKRRKRGMWGHPTPRQEAAAPWIPAFGSFETKLRDDS